MRDENKVKRQFIEELAELRKQLAELVAASDNYSQDTFPPEHINNAREVADSLAVALEQAQIWEQLQKSEARYRTIVEDQNELICRYQADGTLTFVNKTYCRYFGKSQEELVGHSIFLDIPAEEWRKKKQDFALFNPLNPAPFYEHQMVSANGDIRWLQWSNRAVLDKQGQVIEFQAMGRDTTEYTQMEMVPQESEDRFRTLFEVAPIGIVFSNLESQPAASVKTIPQLEFNERFVQMLGYERNELMDLGIQGISHPDDFDKDMAAYKELHEGTRSVYQTEKRYIKKDGSLFWGDLTLSFIRDSSGKAQLSIALISDITERKQTEIALRENEEKFRNLFQFAPLAIAQQNIEISPHKLAEAALKESEDRYRTVVTMMTEGVLLIDGDGTLLASNPSAERIFGLSREQMLQNQKTPDRRWQAIHEDGSPFPVDTYPNRLTLRTGKPYSNVVMGIYKPDGDLIWISLNTYPIFEADESKLKAVVTSFSDITSRVQAEETLKETIEELAQQKSILQSVLDSIGDGVVVADENGEFLLFNPAAERLMGIGAVNEKPDAWSAHYGVFYPDGVTPLPNEEIPLVRAMQGESVDLVETFVRNAQIPDGFYANNTIRPLKDKDGKLIGGVVAFSDISQRKLAENEIKDALTEKELLLRELHHRVKNNMQIVSGLLALQSDYVKDEADAEMFIKSQNRITAMALTHEKMYQSSNLTRVDFDDYVQDLTVDLFAAYQLDPGKISVEIDVNDVSLEIQRAIPCGLIINEIISNALKHAFPGERRGIIKTVLRSDAKGEFELIISDNGVGIPEGIDLHNSSSLGLQLVKDLAEIQLKGQFELDGNGGTTVKVVFS